MNGWIDRAAALSRLGIKAQTLYAYASRGRIRMKPDPTDNRRSLYSADDIAQIAIRKVRGRKQSSIAAGSMDWGEPVLPTSISNSRQGTLTYRGQDVVKLAHTATLEEVAALLWDVRNLPDFSDETEATTGDPFAFFATLSSKGQPIVGRCADNIVQDAMTIIGKLASVCGAAPGVGPIHQRLALGWNCDANVAEYLRRALVVMADHDLNASTFAARVAASTGASLPACMLAGLCTLSGPRHGSAGDALQYLAADAQRHGTQKAIQQWLERDHVLPGFGHNLYSEGDPRATVILTGIKIAPDMENLAAQVFEQTGLRPNCDFALAAMVDALGLPLDAPFKIFLVARAIGWCAHVTEQNCKGNLIRPRGRYIGI